MMRSLVAAVLLLPSVALADTSPYAGFQTRDIKALSPEQVEGLLKGRGMELSLAAELNRHPGPRHVLELAAELDVGTEQIAALEAIQSRMGSDAQALGTQIVEKERELDRLFATGAAEPAEIDRLTGDIGVLVGRLRAVHLKAHLEATRHLTPHQVHRYDVLRGYDGSVPAHQPATAGHGKH